MNPLKELSQKDREEWIEYIANCGLGEMHCISQTGATAEQITEMMEQAEYKLCPGCHWFEEIHEFGPRADDDSEEVCQDCRHEN